MKGYIALRRSRHLSRPLAMAFFHGQPVFLLLIVATISVSAFLPAAMQLSEVPETAPSPFDDLQPLSGEDLAPELSPQVAEEGPASTPPSPGPAYPPLIAGPSTLPEPSSPETAEPPVEYENGEPDLVPDSNSTVLWCAVRDEYADCQYYLSLLDTGAYEWSCVQKQSAMECMESIRDKKVDLISLDAGLAYIAFSEYSMKAIMTEEYCYHKPSYEAVAVVNKESCDEDSRLSLKSFRGSRSCHPGYRMAAGWDFPVYFLVKTGLQMLSFDKSDTDVVYNFFSESCAPSEFEDSGLCTSCGTNGSCDASISNVYQGYMGAFHCLVEGIGDIAFLRSDTVARLSSDGLNAQNWSTKSVNEFMYLCPNGGCRPINDNIGDCKFASVPANVIMTYNSQSDTKRSAIIKTLLNASWADILYSGKNQQDHILSASTQSLNELQQLTRAFLGDAAKVAQVMNSLQDISVTGFLESGNQQLTCVPCTLCTSFFISLVAASLLMVFL